jgi:predicted nucleic acid-binding protein
MEEAIVDTNVLVYDMIEDSVFHEKAASLLDALKRPLIPSVVVEEFLLVLEQLGVSRELIGRKLEEILSWGELVPLGKENFKTSLSMILREGLSFKRFNDKLVLSVAEKRKLPLLTFDAELRKESIRRGVRVLPELTASGP